MFGKLEISQVGLHWDNVTLEIGGYTFGKALFMLPASAILFTMLGLYLDKVLPGRKYGETRSPIFCFSKRFCCKCCGGDNADSDVHGQYYEAGEKPFELKYLAKENYEAVPQEIARLES